MNSEKVYDVYFDWLCDLVKTPDEDQMGHGYTKLLKLLHDTEFTYTHPFDGNRWEDGINLRYRFGRVHRLDDGFIATTLDTKPCSVLEMMVALAVRCEETIMCEPELGDRTGTWFWTMIKSMGLIGCYDDMFDIWCELAKHLIDRMLKRQYKSNGMGGLFYIPNCTEDLRTVEIWTQLMLYLDTIFCY